MNTPSLNPDFFWQNPTAVRLIALLAVSLLVATAMLLRRRKNRGRAAAAICLIVSIGLHVAILVYAPRMSVFFSGGGRIDQGQFDPGMGPVSVAIFDPNLATADSAAQNSPDQARGEESDDKSDNESLPKIAPLVLAKPIADLATLTAVAYTTETDPEPPASVVAKTLRDRMPASLASARIPSPAESTSELDDSLDDWLNETLAPRSKGQRPSMSLPCRRRRRPLPTIRQRIK